MDEVKRRNKLKNAMQWNAANNHFIHFHQLSAANARGEIDWEMKWNACGSKKTNSMKWLERANWMFSQLAGHRCRIICFIIHLLRCFHEWNEMIAGAAPLVSNHSNKFLPLHASLFCWNWFSFIGRNLMDSTCLIKRICLHR